MLFPETKKTFAEKAGCSVRTVTRLCNQGRIRVFNITDRTVKLESYEEFERREVARIIKQEEKTGYAEA